jgi:hypothetical protein
VSKARKLNVTVSLSRRAMQQARMLAARRSISMSRLLEEQIEGLGQEKTYESSRRAALRPMERGIRSGGAPLTPRPELHKR